MVFYLTAGVFLLAYFVLMLAFTCGFRLVLAPRSGDSGVKAGVSVIIPCRNEQENIAGLLHDLNEQDHQTIFFEVIIVNDHSEDSTVQRVSDFIACHPEMPVKLVSAMNESGKKAAIKLGVEEALYELILCTDGDCRVGKFWVGSMNRAFQQYRSKMLIGPVRMNGTGSLFSQIQILEFAGLAGTACGSAALGNAVLCNGANMAFSKQAFLNLKAYEGDMHYRSGDDMFLLQKMKKVYGKRAVHFVKDAGAIVDAQCMSTVKDFFLQRLRWVSKTKGIRDPFIIFTSLAVYLGNLALLLSGILVCFKPTQSGLFVFFVIIKIIADLPLLAASTRFTGQKSLLWLVPLAEIYNCLYVVVVGSLGHFRKVKWKETAGAR